jgi:hypothetical protein
VKIEDMEGNMDSDEQKTIRRSSQSSEARRKKMLISHLGLLKEYMAQDSPKILEPQYTWLGF